MPLAGTETRLLVMNADPVFHDATLELLGAMEDLDCRVVRSLSEAIAVLLEENFDAFVAEAEPAAAVDQAVNIRQHFPSLRILCVVPGGRPASALASASEQNIRIISSGSRWRLARGLTAFVESLDGASAAPAEGIDPCHSLIGNLNQFSAAEILQMSCLSQRSGRFTFKSSRGNSEIYLQQGSVRHAVYGSLEGESAVAEIFRWRQGRFYFEEGIISQVQTVDRPWAHLLIDNLQKLDETLELSATGPV
jgi:Domain of unknown function (DUF4388)